MHNQIDADVDVKYSKAKQAKTKFCTSSAASSTV
jgi:hypothetical protein